MADIEQTEQEARNSEAPATPEEARPEVQAERQESKAERQVNKAERQDSKAAPAERSERKPAPQGERPQGGRGPAPQGQRREGGPGLGNREGRGGPHGGREGGRGERGDRGDDRRGGGDRGRFEGPPEIDIEKLISDPLYLDNQAHGVVSRMRDMDSGTKSQLRRLYNAVRRAVRAPENERQQQFVMLRARLAYTIARHSLRSLDSLEKLLLQVTRKNDARGYERFRDLFEAIVAYNE
jgi:CRISPR type III-A-associated protein Csm2